MRDGYPQPTLVEDHLSPPRDRLAKGRPPWDGRGLRARSVAA